MRAANADLEIGRGELEAPAILRPFRLHQDVGQDRHRVALLDDRLDACESALDVRRRYREFQGVLPMPMTGVPSFHELAVVVVVAQGADETQSTTRRDTGRANGAARS